MLSTEPTFLFVFLFLFLFLFLPVRLAFSLGTLQPRRLRLAERLRR
jgi:hypothetical protein